MRCVIYHGCINYFPRYQECTDKKRMIERLSGDCVYDCPIKGTSEGLRKKALRKLDRKALKRKTDVTEVWICF